VWVCSALSKYVLHLSGYSANFAYEEKWPNPFCMYRKYESGNASVSSECKRKEDRTKRTGTEGQCIQCSSSRSSRLDGVFMLRLLGKGGGKAVYLPERSKKCNPWRMKNNFVYKERYIIYFKQDKPDGFLWSLLWWQIYLELHVDGSVTVSNA
jgi:hypothetical protein